MKQPLLEALLEMNYEGNMQKESGIKSKKTKKSKGKGNVHGARWNMKLAISGQGHVPYLGEVSVKIENDGPVVSWTNPITVYAHERWICPKSFAVQYLQLSQENGLKTLGESVVPGLHGPITGEIW